MTTVRLFVLFAVMLTVAALPSRAQQTPVGSLSGVVTDQDGYGIAHARISIDTGQTATADASGEFAIVGVPAGSHLVTISAPGHHIGAKTIEFVAGRDKTLRVSLTANHVTRHADHPQPATSTFYVTVYPYRSGHHHYGVKQIEVYGYNDPSHHWTQYCWTGHDGPGITVTCSNAPLGETYTVHVTWRHVPDVDADDEQTTTIYRKFGSPFQTITLYNP